MPEPLVLDRDIYLELVAHCYDGLPLEACGLLAADPATGHVVRCYPTDNEAASARVYTVPSRGHPAGRPGRRGAGPRDRRRLPLPHPHHGLPFAHRRRPGPDPGWHYVIVGLGEGSPVVRSYRIVDGTVEGGAGGPRE